MFDIIRKQKRALSLFFFGKALPFASTPTSATSVTPVIAPAPMSMMMMLVANHATSAMVARSVFVTPIMISATVTSSASATSQD